LELFVKALRSRESAVGAYRQALQQSDAQRARRALAYLVWLSPSAARAVDGEPPP
jgi:hypothetical protein